MNLDLLTNATVVEDAIRFVASESQKQLKSSSDNNNDYNKESKETDYDEDMKSDKEGEEITVNNIF